MREHPTDPSSRALERRNILREESGKNLTGEAVRDLRYRLARITSKRLGLNRAGEKTV